MESIIFKEEREMKSVKELLRDEWVKANEQLSKINIKDDRESYRALSDRVTKLEQQLVEIETTELEVEGRAAIQDIEEQLKNQEFEEGKKDRIIRNAVEVAKIVVPVLGAFTMGLISMRWEKEDTLTSTAGKNSLRDVLKFK